MEYPYARFPQVWYYWPPQIHTKPEWQHFPILDIAQEVRIKLRFQWNRLVDAWCIHIDLEILDVGFWERMQISHFFSTLPQPKAFCKKNFQLWGNMYPTKTSRGHTSKDTPTAPIYPSIALWLLSTGMEEELEHILLCRTDGTLDTFFTQSLHM